MNRRRYFFNSLISLISIPELSSGYLTFIVLENTTLFSINNPGYDNTIYYRINGNDWKKFNGTTESLNSLDIIEWVGTELLSNMFFGTFESTGNFNVSGNLLSLLGHNLEDSIDITYTFSGLFNSNEHLISAVNLEFPNYTNPHCYEYMFCNCTSLLEAPASLRTEENTTLCSYCYRSMFEGCTSLIVPPAEIVGLLNENTGSYSNYCCCSMFKNCVSLTFSPIIKCHVTGGGSKFSEMFDGCTSLSEITCLDLNPDSPTNWVRNVASNGIFYKRENAIWVIGNNGIPTNWEINNDYSYSCLMFKALEDTTFTFTTNALQYSINSGSTWTTLAAGTASPTITAGNKILWRQVGLTPTSSGIGTFSATGDFDVFGNVMSLYYGDDFQKKTITNSSYLFKALFKDCVNLINASNLVLPERVAINHGFCFAQLFEGCTSLISAPKLPTGSVGDRCYASMFKNCTSLLIAPEIFSLSSYTCPSMFQGCTSLNYIKCLVKYNVNTSYCGDWVENVSDNGIFVKYPSTNWPTGNSGIPTGWVTLNENETPLIIDKLSIIIADNFNLNNYILPKVINPCNLPITYSSSDSSIISVNNSTGEITLNDYGTVTISIVFAGNETFPTKTITYTIEYYQEMPYEKQYLTFEALEDGTFTFTNTIKYSVDNGITWITLSSGIASPTITVGNKIMWKQTLSPNSSGIGGFSSTGRFNVYGNIMSLLFDDNFIGQIDLTGNGWAFRELFRYCSTLVDASNLILPATILSIGCYVSMFKNCTSLTTAPELPATTLTTQCYAHMFGECSSLLEAPELPATTLANECYSNMFFGCTSLITVPELPATTLVNYCYSSMFNGCTLLNYIKCLATNISANNCTKNWVQNVAASGTFVKADSMTSWTTGNNGIPSGWTVINESNETQN